jgi:hypothetical protein
VVILSNSTILILNGSAHERLVVIFFAMIFCFEMRIKVQY